MIRRDFLYHPSFIVKRPILVNFGQFFNFFALYEGCQLTFSYTLCRFRGPKASFKTLISTTFINKIFRKKMTKFISTAPLTGILPCNPATYAPIAPVGLSKPHQRFLLRRNLWWGLINTGEWRNVTVFTSQNELSYPKSGCGLSAVDAGFILVVLIWLLLVQEKAKVKRRKVS